MTKAETVEADIRRKIRNGEWAPGEKLPSESALCGIFGVSRLTIRSALGVLKAQGLIATRRGSGSVVAEAKSVVPAPEDPHVLSAACSGLPSESLLLPAGTSRVELFEFRRILESESAALAAQRASSAEIEQLGGLTRRMEDPAFSDGIAACDEQFHKKIAEITGNRLIIRIFTLLHDEFRKMFEENVAVLGSFGAAGHWEILSAIEARDASRARDAMAAHLTATMERMRMQNYAGTP